jgi:hypothetical protein
MRENVQSSNSRSGTAMRALRAVSCTILLIHCGGRTSLEDELDAAGSAGAGAAPLSSNHGGAAGDDCVPLPLCAGTGNANSGSAGVGFVHVGCGPDVTVNRRGDPVRICHRIK